MDDSENSATPGTGYRDVKRVVVERILSSTWPPGAMLPPEVDLAREFACTRTTVNRALRELADEGYLERRRKLGTRVRANPQRQAKLSIPLIRDEVEGTGAAYRYALVGREALPAPGWLAARMGLAPGDPVLHVRCMHYADNRPFQFEDRWINIAAVPEAAAEGFAATGPNEWLVQQVPYTRAEFSFAATGAAGEVAEYLGLRAGEPVLAAERLTWLREVPVTLAEMTFMPGYRMVSR